VANVVHQAARAEQLTMMLALGFVGSNVGSKLKKHFRFNGSAFIFNSLAFMA
jgi:uncharacterized membrane protein YeaQ/YmgE (transglycosylase-associated protein family)